MIWTRNDKNLVTKEECLYWNRASQSWIGNDRYGQNGIYKYNRYCDYVYDDKDREVSSMNYQLENNGNWHNNYNVLQNIQTFLVKLLSRHKSI